MKESNTLADNATIKQLQKTVFLNTKGQLMKESNTLACNAATKQFQSRILLDIEEQCMKESNILASNAIIKQLQKKVLIDTKWQFMKELNTLAGNASIKQLQSQILIDTKRQYMKELYTHVRSCRIKTEKKPNFYEININKIILSYNNYQLQVRVPRNETHFVCSFMCWFMLDMSCIMPIPILVKNKNDYGRISSGHIIPFGDSQDIISFHFISLFHCDLSNPTVCKLIVNRRILLYQYYCD